MTEGFAIVPNWLIRDAKVSVYAVAVYAALSSRADKNGICWPSLATLATEARCSENTARKARDELAGLGLVEWSERRDGSRNLSNLYQLNVSARPPKGGAGGAPPPVQEVHQGGAGGAPEEEPLKKNQKKKVKTTLTRGRRLHSDQVPASTEQIDFRRDCHVMLHREPSTEQDEVHWSRMSSASIHEEIQEFWSEIEHGALHDDDLTELLTLPVGAQLSPRAISFIKKRTPRGHY